MPHHDPNKAFYNGIRAGVDNKILTDVRGGKSPKPDPDITQCIKLPSTDPFNLNLLGSMCYICVCDRYGIPYSRRKIERKVGVT